MGRSKPDEGHGEESSRRQSPQVFILREWNLLDCLRKTKATVSGGVGEGQRDRLENSAGPRAGRASGALLKSLDFILSVMGNCWKGFRHGIGVV